MTTNNNSADFAKLGDVEFDGIATLFAWCEDGRKVSGNSALIVLQAAQDLFLALQTIPTLDKTSGMSRRRARLVARHVKRAADHLQASQRCFAKVPKAFLQQYGEILANMRRRQGRRPFNVQQQR